MRKTYTFNQREGRSKSCTPYGCRCDFSRLSWRRNKGKIDIPPRAESYTLVRERISSDQTASRRGLKVLATRGRTLEFGFRIEGFLLNLPEHRNPPTKAPVGSRE